MIMGAEKTIYVTKPDALRLERLLAMSKRTENVEALEEELSRASIVASEEIPANVVTMNSKVRFRDEVTGEESEVTLVYPPQSDVNEGKVSILAPVASALLGLSIGQAIEWPMPNGKTRSFKIVSVLFQPEAAGQYDL
jgi:regulator of nucleoside diphosphate kinase